MVAIPLGAFVFGAIVFIAYQIGLSIWSALPPDLHGPLGAILGLAMLAFSILSVLGFALMAWEKVQRLVRGPSAAELAKEKEEDESRRESLAFLEDIERRGEYMNELDRADLEPVNERPRSS